MTGNVRQMVRTDKERGVIEIRHADSTATDVTDQWLVVRRILDKAKLVLTYIVYIPCTE